MVGKNATFEEIQKQVRNLKLGEFIKFCKDFEIKLPKQVSTLLTVFSLCLFLSGLWSHCDYLENLTMVYRK